MSICSANLFRALRFEHGSAQPHRGATRHDRVCPAHPSSRCRPLIASPRCAPFALLRAAPLSAPSDSAAVWLLTTMQSVLCCAHQNRSRNHTASHPMWRALTTAAARAGAKANTHAAATRAASAIGRPALRSSHAVLPAASLSRIIARSFSKSASPPPPPPATAASAAASSDPFSADSSLWQLDGTASWSTAADGSARLDAAESFGQVVAVSKGIVSVDGVSTAHVGACIQFFATEDVGGQHTEAPDQQRARDDWCLTPCVRLCVVCSLRLLPRGASLCPSTAISRRRCFWAAVRSLSTWA